MTKEKKMDFIILDDAPNAAYCFLSSTKMTKEEKIAFIKLGYAFQAACGFLASKDPEMSKNGWEDMCKEVARQVYEQEYKTQKCYEFGTGKTVCGEDDL